MLNLTASKARTLDVRTVLLQQVVSLLKEIAFRLLGDRMILT